MSQPTYTQCALDPLGSAGSGVKLSAKRVGWCLGRGCFLGKEGEHGECPEIRRTSVGLVRGQKEPSVGTWAVEIHGLI